MPPPPRPNWQRPHHRDTGSWSLSRPIRTAACETAVRPPPRLKPVLHDSAACFGSLEGFKLLSLWVQLERLLHRLSATSSSPHSLAAEVPTLRNGMALKSFSLAALKSYRTYSQARARGGGNHKCHRKKKERVCYCISFHSRETRRQVRGGVVATGLVSCSVETTRLTANSPTRNESTTHFQIRLRHV